MRSVRTWRWVTLGLWIAFGAASCGFVMNTDEPCNPIFDPHPKTEVCKQLYDVGGGRDLISHESEDAFIIAYGVFWALIMVVVGAFRIRAPLRTWEVLLHGFILSAQAAFLPVIEVGSIALTVRYGEGPWLTLWVLFYVALWASLICAGFLRGSHNENQPALIQSTLEHHVQRSADDRRLRVASFILWTGYAASSLMLLFSGGDVQRRFDNGLPPVLDLILGHLDGTFWMGACWAATALIWNALRFKKNLNLADVVINGALLVQQSAALLMLFEGDPATLMWRLFALGLWFWWWITTLRVAKRLREQDRAVVQAIPSTS